ncbi:hypothetical protein BU24DRAFT_418395 [Aaosphaeria arxii CBS 175.79]|uniref:L domain-like protein n=1 Tax=Aaosphaeria arxii CBS 175.79 TaxID=1450172 RepID=A0A6A5Y1P0_9PLEO|nr:uncharacterized protein BU24DRAFT_418395 [Aaosphaeria arxii CBS 175.79]KAF2018841.1 hypothetical protein BU24DRAFT_418395 [Aaosphaeria arxii CBS 175.79]
MKPWLDDLSEEWVPQPAPTTDSHSPVDSSPKSSKQSVISKPQSRLPRLRQSSGSFSEISVRQVARDLKPAKRRSALVERSLSDNNVHPVASTDVSEVAGSTVSSGASLDESFVCNGTVEQKPKSKSPDKQVTEYDTPEWRRRLLKGDIGYGDQKDLFSPMGLENIFQKPSAERSDAQTKEKSRLGMLKKINAIPSSPPPWPTAKPSQAEEDQLVDELLDLSISNAQAEENHDASLSEQYGQSSIGGSQIRHSTSQPSQRTISGQIEFENESFSPVYLTTNLKVGQNAAPIPNFTGSELADRLRHIGPRPPTVGIQPASEGSSSIQNTREESSFSRLQDMSLPEDLPAGTPDFADVGRFVEMRRGGYSRDGSFRRRPLSPSPQAKLATRLSSTAALSRISAADEDEQSSSPTKSPTTPHRPRQSDHLSPDRARTSGSPLKLFDAHDTFTSNRLQRRLSQLDYRVEQSSTNDQNSDSTKILQKQTRLTSVEETSVHMSTAGPSDKKRQTDALEPVSANIENFGQGALDQYSFPEELSILSSQASQLDNSGPDGSPSIEVAPPGSRHPMRFQYDDGSPPPRTSSRAKRQGLTRISSSHRRISQTPSLQPGGAAQSPLDEVEKEDVEQEYAEGKRGPTSPFKNPTPKRRRTLQALETEGDTVDCTTTKPVQDSHDAMQSVISRKRKDARHDHSMHLADPEVLARRQILRPRNPTPSQRRREEVQAEILEATEAFLLSSPKLHAIREQLDSSPGPDSTFEESRATAVATQVAAFSMRRTEVARDESRKRSVTTQDFLDEALKIMDYIRTKGRPMSGLASLEETEAESPFVPDEDAPPSTPLSFSRPPSREGRQSEWKEPNKRDLDPTVISHLRRYQDKESDEFMGSSFRSLHLPYVGARVAQDENSIVAEQDNIRITDNLDRHNRTPKDATGGHDSQPRTGGTHPSTGSSMAQTVVTSASRRSDNVTTIAAEKVAHLIPEQIAGMSFDREKNIWVRQRSITKEVRTDGDLSNTLDSEEDPFGNIPDLSVDETAEYLMNKNLSARPQATAETFLEDTEVVHEDEEVPRPTTREGQSIPPIDSSSVPSKVSNFAWSFPKTETRATSWSDQETQRGGTQKLQPPPVTYAIPESDEADVEHEIKYFEGRGTAPPPVPQAKIRDITFSIDEQDFSMTVEQQGPRQHPRGWSTTGPKRNPRKTPLSGARTLPNRQKAVMRPNNELDTVEETSNRNYRMQVSMNVSAPVLQKQDMLFPPSSPAKGDVTFMLSDLPEFTLHQVDECELPDRVVVKHDGIGFSKALEDRYAQGTADLVKALQDVKPDEPYWEDIREIDLHDRSLANLHRLDEFCYRLETLDVSDNSISQVKGIPDSVRRLRAENNCLTGLTSWGSLLNLQHLDVSGNDIDSLDGLGDLIHLRTLKIDNNRVESLEGIFHLDGLMELSASGNCIEFVDFARSNLQSLTDLNLRGNNIVEVRNLHHLKQIRHLNLDDNDIEAFPVCDELDGRCNMLRSVRLCRNDMSSLTVESHFPNLESLYVDGNALSHIPGLARLKHLRTLSWREQSVAIDTDAKNSASGPFGNADIRSLYLSMNQMRTLEVSQHLLNLQRLELSSMGLDELPDDLGQLMPNIRSINLNFNSIKDLRPLLNIKRLNELLIAGNKIARLRTNLAVLGKLTTLKKIDLRENPLTLRFYAPTSENRVLSLRHKPIPVDDDTERFVLPDGDAEADKQYLERLDFETRLRRRVQEILLCTNCKNLEDLDGLPFDRERILVKDDIWERLLYLGVVKKSENAGS